MHDWERLAQTIYEHCGCSATYVRADDVAGLDGAITTVGVYAIHGHARAGIAYAWSYDDADRTRDAVMIGIPPVNSAARAVQTHAEGAKAGS